MLSSYRLPRVLALLLTTVALAAPSKEEMLAAEKVTPSTKLTAGNYSSVRDAVLARPTKELWTDIPWRPNLAEAIKEAREKDKPILLWMMNGHPCGMT